MVEWPEADIVDKHGEGFAHNLRREPPTAQAVGWGRVVADWSVEVAVLKPHDVPCPRPRPFIPDSEFLGKERAVGDVGGADGVPLAVVVLDELLPIGDCAYQSRFGASRRAFPIGEVVEEGVLAVDSNVGESAKRVACGVSDLHEVGLVVDEGGIGNQAGKLHLPIQNRRCVPIC